MSDPARPIATLVSVVLLAALGIVYVAAVPEPDPFTVGAIAAGVAGLGGYDVKRRHDAR